MNYQVQTAYNPVVINVKVESNKKIDLAIIGYDPYKINTVYFKRDKTFQGIEELKFPCPQSPRKLKVVIFDRAEGQRLNSKTFKAFLSLEKLKTNRHLISSEHIGNIEFIENFCRKAGFLPSRSYKSKDGLVIDYLPSIRLPDGTLNHTPARIHKKKNSIQVSKKHFIRMTIPMRIAILLHEYSHNYSNITQDSEGEADFNAMEFYTKLGYPDIEAIYAFTKIFKDNDDSVERVRSIMLMLKNNGHASNIYEGGYENSII